MDRQSEYDNVRRTAEQASLVTGADFAVAYQRGCAAVSRLNARYIDEDSQEWARLRAERLLADRALYGD